MQQNDKQQIELFLQNLQQKDADEIFNIFVLNSNYHTFLDTGLQSSSMSSVIKLFKNMLILGKKKRVQILNLFRELLMEKVFIYLEKISIQTDTKELEKFPPFIDDLLEILLSFTREVPNIAREDDFSELIAKIKLLINSTNNLKYIDSSLIYKFLELEGEQHDISRFSKIKINKRQGGQKKPPDDFRKISLYPSLQDLQQKQLNFLRPNITKGAYKNVDDYLDTHFRLLKEDFIQPLRYGLKKYKESPSDVFKYRFDNIRVYTKTKFEKLNFRDTGSISYVLNFDVDGLVKTNWDTSRYFMHGSLLLFSNNDFRTFFCGTVQNHDLEMLRSGRLLVTLVEQSNDNILFDSYFAMIESDVYFEPYHVVMKVLKELNENSFPMRKHIIEAVTKTDPPLYLSRFREWFVFNFRTRPLKFETWPSHEDVGLDLYQYKAMQAALTRSFCIIQGPPGTGKTYVGLQIVEVILNNMKNYNNYVNYPILIISYTNHALDQFLEGVLHFTTDIIRLGGQSRSEKLNFFNMKEVKNSRRRTDRRNDYTDDLEDRLRQQIRFCRKRIHRLLEKVDLVDAKRLQLENPNGIFLFDSLVEFMNEKEKLVINDDYSLLGWLLDVDEITYSSDVDIEYDFNFENFTFQNEVIMKENLDDDIYAEMPKESGNATNGDAQQSPHDTEEEQSKKLGYSVTLDGLRHVCHLRQKEIIEYEVADNKNNYWYRNSEHQKKVLLEKYCILKENLQKNLVDVKLYMKSYEKDPMSLPLDMRWNTYWMWVQKLKKEIENQLNSLKFQYRFVQIEMERFQHENDALVLGSVSLVGMTTTYAARSHKVLEKLKPAVVIIEEAAEVLETHIVAALTKNTQHLIMIGDHKQLRPQTAVDELSKKYYMDVSLFERMINNGMDCPNLKVQHRMRPEISSLISPAIYKQLDNHYSVTKYESVAGVEKNLFFLTHNAFEAKAENFQCSWMNEHEADFVIQLCVYLLHQGYDDEEITILTTYAGQKQLLKTKQKSLSEAQRVHITVVDEYQGEENEIIILSLVRSNVEANIGYLRTENRVCVALSRAKKGFFMIGNMDILSKYSPLWQKVKKNLEKLDAIGTQMILHCDKHDIRTPVSTARDFETVQTGGCNLICGDTLDCSHMCKKKCHSTDREHEFQFACRVMCKRILRCGHDAFIECSKTEVDYLCKEIVEFVSQRCGHVLRKECYEDVIQCSAPCEEKLKCGHSCPLSCFHSDDHDKIKCYEHCTRKYTCCNEKHYCQKLCHEFCGNCSEIKEILLNCNHIIKVECSSNITELKCSVRCQKICTWCNQPCQKLCSEPCAPCTNEVTKVIQSCGHEIKVLCSVAPEQILCQVPCTVNRKAACGHNAIYGVICSELNTNFDPEVYLPNCEELCEVELDCGHTCIGTCGKCIQGRLHQGCLQVCGKELICGHHCKFACQEVCPPCSEATVLYCGHGPIKKCGILNSKCEVMCKWKCKHKICTRTCAELCDREPCSQPCTLVLKCGHKCLGFCGEPCPQMCRICDKEIDSVLERYVFLEDCGCVVKSNTFEKYLSDLKGTVAVYRCPICNVPITKTLRFMNPVKKIYSHVANIKKKLYGLDVQLIQIRTKLIEKLKEYYSFENKGLPQIQKIKNFFLRTLLAKHVIVSKLDVFVIDYFTEIFNIIGRRLASINQDIVAAPATQKAITCLCFILNRIESRLLLTNMLVMEGLRCEIIRFHKILNYSILLNETPNKRMKKVPKLKELCNEMEKLLYNSSRFTSVKEEKFEKLFDEFSNISSSKIKWNYRNELTTKVTSMHFLDPFRATTWFVCSEGHYYCSYDSLTRLCTECEKHL